MNKKNSLTRIFASTLLLAASLLVTNSCNNEESPKPDTTASQVIGETGGALSGKDGVLTISVPEGAMAANTTVSIEVSAEEAPSNGIGKVYTLSPEGTQFTKPVKLSFQYTDADALNTPPSSMAIAYKKSDNTWEVMPTLKSNDKPNTLTTETTHFSQWTILEVPAITSFEPASAAVGALVTIKGTNFSNSVSENTVSFNGKPATILSATTNEIIAEVPTGATSGKIMITTIFNDLNWTTISETDFIVETNEPVITSFSPANGAAGTTVTITGKNFSAIASDNKIYFNGLQTLTVATISSTQLSTIVPAGATTGKILVTTMYNNLNWTVTSTTDFIVDSNEPLMTSFSPASGIVGTIITIVGKNFSATASENSVLINGMPTTVITSSTTQLTFKVPAGATTGKIMVQTMYNGLNYTVQAATDFTVN